MTQHPAAWRRTAVATLTLAALGLTASACGGAGDANAARTPAGSPGATTSSGADGGGTGGSDAFAPGSAVDVASVKQMFSDAIGSASTVHVEMKMTGAVTMTGSGDMDMKAKPVKASLQLSSSTLGSGTIAMLMVDDAMYLRSPAFGEKYVKVSTTDKNSPISQMGLSSLDPSAMFDRFGDAITGGTYVGKESVDGTQTDHYRLTVDAKAVASALPSEAAGAASAIPATETMDVWFDGDGRYKKMTMAVGGENVTETFSNWGEPVDISAPPAGQVQDMSSLMSGLGGS